MVALDRAIDTACRGEEARAHIVGRRGVRVHAHVVLGTVHRSGSARRHLANPSSVPEAAAGRARRSRCTRASTRAGRSAAGTAGSAAGGAAGAGVARRRGAARPRRTLAAETSSGHRTPGVHGWSRGKHSWRGWPTPAHSPIRPPPSTRRGYPR